MKVMVRIEEQFELEGYFGRIINFTEHRVTTVKDWFNSNHLLANMLFAVAVDVQNLTAKCIIIIIVMLYLKMLHFDSNYYFDSSRK